MINKIINIIFFLLIIFIISKLNISHAACGVHGITNVELKKNDLTNFTNNIIDTNNFVCLVTVPATVDNWDKCNVCGLKINAGWPINCPWDQGQPQVDGKSKFNCSISGVAVGSTIVPVALRTLPWEGGANCTGDANPCWQNGSYFSGQTFYYQTRSSPSNSPQPSQRPSSPPGSPTPTATCQAPAIPVNLQPRQDRTAGVINFSWDQSTGAARYALRIDDKGTDWHDGWPYDTVACNRCQDTGAGSNPHDICCNTITSTSFQYQLRPGHHYTWWIHAINTPGDVACTKWSEAATATFSIIQPTTPTITPVLSATPIPNCSCAANKKCSSTCVDRRGVMLENFDCETTANCQNDYARTKGDATGDNKTCGNDYVEILKSFHNQYQDNRVKFLRADFNGDGEVGSLDIQIFQVNFNPVQCESF